MKQNARKSSKVSNINSKSRKLLETWLEADYKLYNHFVTKLKGLIEQYGSDNMRRDVEKLKKLNEKLKQDCVLEVADNSKLKGEFK